MKYFLYIFTISLLLWVVFNSEGIIRYQKENTKLKALDEQLESADSTLELKANDLQILKDYIKSILDSPALTMRAPSNIENIERELILKGIIPKDKKILRWNKKKALSK